MKKLEIDPKAKALIFDLDGTLADTMPVHFWAYKNIVSEYGIDFTPELFAKMSTVQGKEELLIAELVKRFTGSKPVDFSWKDTPSIDEL